MNLFDFNRLAIGDKVENAMTHGEGTVSDVREVRSGRVVSVKWGPGQTLEFSYTMHSTAWMHWNKVEPVDFKDCGRRGGNCQCQSAAECVHNSA